MRVFPTGRVGIVIFTCVVAVALGSVLNGFIQQVGEMLANDAEVVPARSTAMVRPSDEHVSSYVEPMPTEVVDLTPSSQASVALPVVVSAPIAPTEEEAVVLPMRGRFPEAVVRPRAPVESGWIGTHINGGAPAVDAPPEARADLVIPSAAGPSETEVETQVLAACTEGGSSGATPRHGILGTRRTLSEWNDFQTFSLSEEPRRAAETFSTELHLSDSEEPGLYEFAVLSDLRVRLESQISGDQWEVLASGNGASAETLHCGRRWVRMQRYTWAPLRLSVSGPSGSDHTVAVLWRKVSEGRAGRAEEPLCGSSGSPISSGALTSEWSELFRRGWSVIPVRDFYLPGSMATVSCAFDLGTWSGSQASSVSPHVLFGAAEGTSWSCSSGVQAFRLGTQVVLDFGSSSCSGPAGAEVPQHASCLLTPPPEVSAQALVDKVAATRGALGMRALFSGSSCVDVRELSF